MGTGCGASFCTAANLTLPPARASQIACSCLAAAAKRRTFGLPGANEQSGTLGVGGVDAAQEYVQVTGTTAPPSKVDYVGAAGEDEPADVAEQRLGRVVVGVGIGDVGVAAVGVGHEEAGDVGGALVGDRQVLQAAVAVEIDEGGGDEIFGQLGGHDAGEKGAGFQVGLVGCRGSIGGEGRCVGGGQDDAEAEGIAKNTHADRTPNNPAADAAL